MKKIITFTVCLALILSALATLTLATDKGLDFSGSTYCTSSKPLGSAPYTIELVIEVDPQTPSTMFGTLVSTKGNGAESYFELQIRDGGYPAMVWKTKDGSEQLVNFTQSNVDLRGWGKRHLTVTVDGNKVTIYNNGDEARSRGDKTLGSLTDVGEFMVGNNFDLDRSLDGVIIYSLALFSGVRNSSQIKADMNGIDLSDSTLLACYDFSSLTGEEVKDVAKASNHLSVTAPSASDRPDDPTPPVITDPAFFKDKAPVTDYDYSFAVLGDTQIVSRNDALNGTKHFEGIYKYILDNISSKKIKAVIGVGDIMDNKVPETEWPNAKKVISTLTGKVPYILARGNHDSRGWFEQLNRESYATVIDGKNGNDIATAYKKITIGETKYLIMSLDYGINDSGLDWANDIVAANPDYNVIVTTHGYMEADGSITDENGTHPATWNHEDGNNGVDIWDKFIRKHKNIVLVLCGHISSEKIVVRTDKGDNGNTVTSVLIDNQDYENNNGSMGFITMLYFSDGGSSVEVECYSTVMQAYYRNDNQFSIELDMLDKTPHVQTTPEQTTPEQTTLEQTTPEQTTPEQVIQNQTTGKANNDDGNGVTTIVTVAIAVAVGVAIGSGTVFILFKKKK